MQDFGSRQTLDALGARQWDVLVIGGGIVGAGVMREAARTGLRVLLVEQNDFASGTSSRSSKLIHGGVHYLARLQIGLVREAVREREALVGSESGLVERMDFIAPVYARMVVPAWAVAPGISVYELLAGRFPRNLKLSSSQVAALGITRAHLKNVFHYREARTDDARLVLRVLQEGARLGGRVVNYMSVRGLLRDHTGTVIGARVFDRETGLSADVRARAVVNATGPWADQMTDQLGLNLRLRLVRGSHLVFPRSRLPLDQAIGFQRRDAHHPNWLVPWENVTIVGSTNIEHGDSLTRDPRISADETADLLSIAQLLFPSQHLSARDILATFSGVRPLIDSRTSDPATASRDYIISEQPGMVTITGGKLTLFRLMALKTLQKLSHHLPEIKTINSSAPILEKADLIPEDIPLAPATARRIAARYGVHALEAIAKAPAPEQCSIPGLDVSTAELRYVLRCEAVRHLDDLMLRRFRMGLTTTQGGIQFLPAIRPIAQAELGWDDQRWNREAQAYAEKWQWAHSVPDLSGLASAAR